MKTKTFDCVEMKRRAAERIYQETKDLTLTERIDYWRRRSEEFRRERERLLGLRQGVAAGIRAAAREEVRDSAKREALDETLEHHWREQRRRSVARSLG